MKNKLWFFGVRVNENGTQFSELFSESLILAAELQGFLKINENDFREGHIQSFDANEIYEAKMNSDVWSQIEIYDSIPKSYTLF